MIYHGFCSLVGNKLLQKPISTASAYTIDLPSSTVITCPLTIGSISYESMDKKESIALHQVVYPIARGSSWVDQNQLCNSCNFYESKKHHGSYPMISPGWLNTWKIPWKSHGNPLQFITMGHPGPQRASHPQAARVQHARVQAPWRAPGCRCRLGWNAQSWLILVTMVIIVVNNDDW